MSNTLVHFVINHFANTLSHLHSLQQIWTYFFYFSTHVSGRILATKSQTTETKKSTTNSSVSVHVYVLVSKIEIK